MPKKARSPYETLEEMQLIKLKNKRKKEISQKINVGMSKIQFKN